jgi:S1-C subfamily serine protease
VRISILSLSIPGNVVLGLLMHRYPREIYRLTIADGKVTRGYLGVKIQALTPELATQLKLSGQTGALVGEVTSNSPAEKAGLKRTMLSSNLTARV